MFKTSAIKAGSVHTDYSRCFLASLFIWCWGAVIDQDPDQVLHLLQESNWWMWHVAWCFLSWLETMKHMKQQGLFVPSFLHGGFGYQQFLILHRSMYFPRVSWSGVLLNAQEVHPGWNGEAFSNVLSNLMIIIHIVFMKSVWVVKPYHPFSLSLSLFLFKPKNTGEISSLKWSPLYID